MSRAAVAELVDRGLLRPAGPAPHHYVFAPGSLAGSRLTGQPGSGSERVVTRASATSRSRVLVSRL